MGNSALLRCIVPEYVRQYVTVSTWYKGDEVLLPDLSDIGTQNIIDYLNQFNILYCKFTAGRYVVLSSSGDLYIRAIRSEDALMKFSCLTTNTLSGERQRSDSVSLTFKGIIHIILYAFQLRSIYT